MLATSSEMPKVLVGRREGTLDLVAVDQVRLATGRARAARQAVGDLRDIGLRLNRTTSFVCSTMPSASARAAFRPPLRQLLREFAAIDRREELPVLVLSEVPRGQGGRAIQSRRRSACPARRRSATWARS